jgi:CRISPR/Cas system-associated exonuclease Cas4 (RecB family)
MEKRTRNLRLVGRDEVSLGELIHQAVRKTIEEAVEECTCPAGTRAASAGRCARC